MTLPQLLGKLKKSFSYYEITPRRPVVPGASVDRTYLYRFGRSFGRDHRLSGTMSST